MIKRVVQGVRLSTQPEQEVEVSVDFKMLCIKPDHNKHYLYYVGEMVKKGMFVKRLKIHTVPTYDGNVPMNWIYIDSYGFVGQMDHVFFEDTGTMDVKK